MLVRWDPWSLFNQTSWGWGALYVLKFTYDGTFINQIFNFFPSFASIIVITAVTIPNTYSQRMLSHVSLEVTYDLQALYEVTYDFQALCIKSLGIHWGTHPLPPKSISAWNMTSEIANSSELDLSLENGGSQKKRERKEAEEAGQEKGESDGTSMKKQRSFPTIQVKLLLSSCLVSFKKGHGHGWRFLIRKVNKILYGSSVSFGCL